MASKADSDRTERVVTSTCSYDCGARCLLKVHVSEGRVERILTENQAGLSLKACGRGLAQGHDHGGCVNVLTRDRKSPGGGAGGARAGRSTEASSPGPGAAVGRAQGSPGFFVARGSWPAGCPRKTPKGICNAEET